jgi:hypothetical protein
VSRCARSCGRRAHPRTLAIFGLPLCEQCADKQWRREQDNDTLRRLIKRRPSQRRSLKRY